MIVLLGLMLHQAAVARPFYVEGPALRMRSEAASIAKLVEQAGYRARVVRRYGHGDGWRFAVVLDGFDGKDQATDAAYRVSSLTGRSYAVFLSDEAQPARALPEVIATPDDADAPTTAVILARARRAHGGEGVLDKVRGTEDLVFRFMRRTADGRSILHTYARRGAERYLRIDVMEGRGTSSEMRFASGAGWLRTEKSGWQEQDGARTVEVIDAFAPERVLEAALVLPEAMTHRRELALLRLASTAPDAVELRYEGAGRPVAMWVDRSTDRVSRLVVGEGADRVVRTLSGDAGSVLAPVPERMRTHRGDDLLDDVQVMLLEAGGAVPQAWFSEPGT